MSELTTTGNYTVAQLEWKEEQMIGFTRMYAVVAGIMISEVSCGGLSDGSTVWEINILGTGSLQCPTLEKAKEEAQRIFNEWIAKVVTVNE